MGWTRSHSSLQNAVMKRLETRVNMKCNDGDGLDDCRAGAGNDLGNFDMRWI